MRLLLACVLCAAAMAQDPGPPTVRAHGTAIVSVKPDQVKIEIGVVTEAATAQAAGAENATRVTAVTAEVKRALPAGAELRTTGYSLNPNYVHPRDGGRPKIVGYIASNTVRVTSGDLEGIGKVIDAATRVGANNINSITFSLKDEQAPRAEALGKATRQARANAEAMAAALGMKVLRVHRVEDSAAVQVYPVRETMMMRAAAVADAPPTPVQPGTIQVSATVQLTVILAAP